MSTGSNDTVAASKNKETGGLLMGPPKTRNPGLRDSNALMISGESYNPSEIGKAVQLSVVEEQRGNQGPVKQTYVQSKIAQTPENADEKANTEAGAGDDDVSLFSSSTVHLGRLDTMKSQNKDSSPPQISMSTALEEVVPPRLTRRPISEVIPPLVFPTPSYKNHRHRFSLNITDDLDKLMEKASILSVEKSSALGSLHEGGGDHGDHGDHDDEQEREVSQSTTTSMSKESFLTADDISLEEKTELPLSLPKRPNAQSLSRAREASVSQKKSGTKEVTGSSDPDSSLHSSDQVSAHTWKEKEAQNQVKLKRTLITSEHDNVLSPLDAWNSSYGSSKYDENPTSDSTNSRLRGQGSVSSRQSWTPLNASNSSKIKTGPETANRPKNEANTDPAKSPLNHGSHKRTDTVITYSDLGTDTPKYRMSREVLSPAKVGLLKTYEASEIEKARPVSFPESSGSTTAPLETTSVGVQTPEKQVPLAPTPEKHPETNAEHLTPVDDDGFYDIEEPVVVSHPARAKSVRDNTRGPPRKGSHRRSRRFRLKETAEVGPLKPFSYNTLVHLLESMNGTVIGEEFEMLNLPIQEKQLIEKVIDLLSRLTLDMVTDKHRFEIGLQRLEKAHRVLEGFL